MIKNREEWLTQAAEVLTVYIKKRQTAPHADFPRRYSVGLPFGRDQRKLNLWASQGTDGTTQVYLSPLVADAQDALGLLYDYLIAQLGHSQALPILLPPPLSEAILSTLGDYPQSAIALPEYAKQETRMRKVQCATCGYTARVTAKWLRLGAPLCPQSHGPLAESTPSNKI